MSIQQQLGRIQRIRHILNDYEKELEACEKLSNLSKELPTKIELTSFSDVPQDYSLIESRGKDLTSLINSWWDEHNKLCKQYETIIERILEVM